MTDEPREPGVARQFPHLGNDGRGVNRPQLREPGVSRQLPHLGNNGKGVNHAGLREPGVDRISDRSRAVGVNYQKAPFPWFGGKSRAAEAVWAELGDVAHYVEPFFGSGAVLLNRPHLANRTYFSETVNDLDGLLVNAWRSILWSPEETALHASWPVAEADLHARHVALVRWRTDETLALLSGNPEWHDPQMAGWWLWGISCWIGSGWCSGTGPWTADDTGRLYKQGRGPRDAGVDRKRPHLSNNGQGVNHAGLREPGVDRQRPHLTGGGRGVNHAGLREPGVEYHDVVMPGLVEWFGWLSARLRHVRILNGDWLSGLHAWSRPLTSGASKILSVRQGGTCGVFLDPPYADTADRDPDIYAHDSLELAHEVRRWCLDHGDDPDYRIVLAGFDGEHGTELVDAGWREVEWFGGGGWLGGGMGNTGGKGHQQARERLWASPHCLGDAPADIEHLTMFD